MRIHAFDNESIGIESDDGQMRELTFSSLAQQRQWLELIDSCQGVTHANHIDLVDVSDVMAPVPESVESFLEDDQLGKHWRDFNAKADYMVTWVTRPDTLSKLLRYLCLRPPQSTALRLANSGSGTNTTVSINGPATPSSRRASLANTDHSEQASPTSPSPSSSPLPSPSVLNATANQEQSAPLANGVGASYLQQQLEQRLLLRTSDDSFAEREALLRQRHLAMLASTIIRFDSVVAASFSLHKFLLVEFFEYLAQEPPIPPSSSQYFFEVFDFLFDSIANNLFRHLESRDSAKNDLLKHIGNEQVLRRLIRLPRYARSNVQSHVVNYLAESAYQQFMALDFTYTNELLHHIQIFLTQVLRHRDSLEVVDSAATISNSLPTLAPVGLRSRPELRHRRRNTTDGGNLPTMNSLDLMSMSFDSDSEALLNSTSPISSPPSSPPSSPKRPHSPSGGTAAPERTSPISPPPPPMAAAIRVEPHVDGSKSTSPTKDTKSSSHNSTELPPPALLHLDHHNHGASNSSFLALLNATAKQLVTRALFHRDTPARVLTLKLIQTILGTVARSIEADRGVGSGGAGAGGIVEGGGPAHPVVQELTSRAKSLKHVLKHGNSDKTSAPSGSFRLETIKTLTAMIRNCSFAHLQPLMVKSKLLFLCIDVLLSSQHQSILQAAIVDLVRLVFRLHFSLTLVLLGPNYGLLEKLLGAYEREVTVSPVGSSLTAYILELAIMVRDHINTNSSVDELPDSVRQRWIDFDQGQLEPHISQRRSMTRTVSRSSSTRSLSNEANLIRLDEYNYILTE